MRYLLYCIFRSPQPQKPGTLLGVGGQPVSLVATNGLSAAISKIFHPDMTPDINRVLAYEKVVKLFHHDRTVIPMRYGCVFEEESQVIRLLEERGQHYETLLKELEGCVEMGVRVLISPCAMQNTENGFRNSPSPIQKPQPSNPGSAYLSARKAHYAQEERFAKENNLVIERCRAAFAGLFVKFKSELPPFRLYQSTIGDPMLSLYFLVPRRSVERFRQVFRRIRLKESAKLLLSGPWPPYNFVLPTDEPKQDGWRGLYFRKN